MRMYVDSAVAHFDEIINLKSILAKSDVFHIFSGMWKTPAERCFMWVGGFRPSDLLKVHIYSFNKSNPSHTLFKTLKFLIFVRYDCYYVTDKCKPDGRCDGAATGRVIWTATVNTRSRRSVITKLGSSESVCVRFIVF